MPSLSKNNIVFVATPEQLLCKQCYRFMWSIAAPLTDLRGCRGIISIEEMFRDLDILGIEIRHPNGDLFEIPYIFEVFGDDLESGRRWMTNFRKAAPNGIEPASYCDCIPKLLCIELWLQCTVSAYSRGPETPRCSFTHVPLGW